MYRQTVKHTGRAIKPLSPVLLNAVRGADDRLRFTWTRRARINAGWNDFADVPLDEPDELYDVELVTNDVLALRLLYLPDWDRREVDWTLGQQIAATNQPVQQVVLRVWQKSNRVGRGELAEAVVSAPLMPFSRNWNDGSLAGHTLFGTGNPVHAIVSSRYQLSTSFTVPAYSRLDTAYSVTNFALEVDLIVSGNNAGRHGVVYRTTDWAAGILAYVAWIIPVIGTGILLRLQSNGNDLQTVSIPGPETGTFRMRLEVIGSTHRVFINGVQRISLVDSSFLSPGQFGLYMSSNTQVAQFDNLRIDY
jgi:hypothetical protein